MRTFTIRTLVFLAAILLLNVPANSSFAQDGEEIVVPLQFVTHVQFGAAEQDVFLDNGDGTVRRVTGEEDMAALFEPLYATATMIEHDPFVVGENPFGPYEQGAELDLTLIEWMAGTGSGTYTVNGDTALIEAEFTGLIPNGVYTLWCSQVLMSEGIEIIDEPCGAEDGSENLLIVDEEGNGTFFLEVDLLPRTTETEMTMIAIAYHSNAQTYGAYPGDFGLNSHVQLITPVGY